MKTKFLLCLTAVFMFTVVQGASAQNIGQPMGGVYGGGGGQVYEPGAFQPVVGDLQTGMPGRIWVEASLAERGLGFQGSYATIGAKQRLFEDFLDGRWLGEARLHHSLNGGGFFANFGIERVFSVDSAGAEVSMGLWGDYDSDQQGNFAHTFQQWGVTGQIKTKNWDLIGNGYFPEGTTGYTQGDPTGENCFFGHSIIVQPGIDSALKGFDVTLRVKPRQLSFVNGTLELGGYGYQSDLVQFFGGGRARVGFQVLNGLIVNTEVNYDDRFDVTGVVSLGWVYGVNARGNEYSGLGRDLEATQRNDHIIRFQQDVVLALDPDTGRPYDVFHVNNTADAGVADGTAERPFTTLADVEAAAGEGDIIFVDEGDGTSRGMRDGIQLRNDQLFLGDGVEHIIPIQNGLNFVLCNDNDGNRPTISGSNNGAAVTLANNNVVAGFNIDGNEGVGNMSYGIFGNGNFRGETITNGTIRDNIISNAILDGVSITNIDGDWNFERNEINNNAFDGIRIVDACDPNSIFRFEENEVNENGRDGISIENYDAQALTFLNNITNDNGRDGIRLTNFKNTSGNGLPLDILNHSATGNNGFAINIMGGDGNLRVLNANLNANIGGGLNIVDWTNTDPNTMTLIGTSGGGTSSFLNNQPGVGINVELNSGIQRLVITDTTLDGNGYGFIGTSNGIGTQLITSVVDNLSVSNNLIDGLRVVATDGGSHRAFINQNGTGLGRLVVNGNQGSGISFFSGDSSGNVSIVEAFVEDINATGNQQGLFSDVIGDGSLQLAVTDSNFDNNGNGMFFNLDGDETGIINTIDVRNVTMLDNVVDGINLSVLAGTFVDFRLVDSVIESTTQIDAGGDNNNIRLGGFGNGLDIDIFGDNSVDLNNNPLNPQIDTRVRLFVQGNTIDEFFFDGIAIDTFGDAHLSARIEGNSISQNGFGNGGGGGVGTATLPFFDGLNITSNDESRIDARITGNDISLSSERGITMQTNGLSTINAIWLANDLSNNDQAEDTNNDPIIDQNLFDFDIFNGVTGSMCVSMSNNFWNNGFNIVNGSASTDFILELDGNSNLFNINDLNPADFTSPAFGSTCEGIISTEEAVFASLGFPPID